MPGKLHPNFYHKPFGLTTCRQPFTTTPPRSSPGRWIRKRGASKSDAKQRKRPIRRLQNHPVNPQKPPDANRRIVPSKSSLLIGVATYTARSNVMLIATKRNTYRSSCSSNHTGARPANTNIKPGTTPPQTSHIERLAPGNNRHIHATFATSTIAVSVFTNVEYFARTRRGNTN